jgi:hypothetical protein
MRLLDGAPQREAANIGRKFRELNLIELMTAMVQNPASGVSEDPPIALQMLERDLGVISAVVQVDRR